MRHCRRAYPRSAARAFAVALMLPGAALAATNKNLVSDGGVTPTSSATAIAAAMQKLVDEIASDPQGGTLTIPGDYSHWTIDRPIFVSGNNITIKGDGDATQVFSAPSVYGTSLFILGAKSRYAGAAITAAHRPSLTGLLDGSAGAGRYGLRTWADGVSASGYFPFSPFCVGPGVAQNMITYWHDDPSGKMTFDLCVVNNGTGVMKGTICGAGAGGPHGDITDPRTIYTLEASPTDGTNVKFRFKTVDAHNGVAIDDILLSAAALGAGVHRFSVQIDLSSNLACGWFSTSASASGAGLVAPALTTRLKLASGLKFKAFEYGALRLGRTTAQPFSGTPSVGNGTDGDWTYAGLAMRNKAVYDMTGAMGSAQALAGGGALNDGIRFLAGHEDNNLVALLTADAPGSGSTDNMLVSLLAGRSLDGNRGWGYWLPDRKVSSVLNSITLSDMHLDIVSFRQGCAVTVAEAGNVRLKNIYQEHCLQGISSWGCVPAPATLQISQSYLNGTDACLFANGQQLDIVNAHMASVQSVMCAVGCNGQVKRCMAEIPSGTPDYMFKLLSGANGGPLTFLSCDFDEEGYPRPNLGIFYAEPSAGDPTSLEIRDYDPHEPSSDFSIVELADPPGNPPNIAPAKLTIETGTVGAAAALVSIVNCHSSNWYGKILDFDPNWLNYLNYGPVKYDGPPDQCHIMAICSANHVNLTPRPTYQFWSAAKTYGTNERVEVGGKYYRALSQNTNAAPATTPQIWVPIQITFLAGTFTVQVPHVSLLPSPHFTEFKCTRTGTYGTGRPADEPVFTGSNPMP